MQLALVHLDRWDGPVGVWRISDGELAAYYPDEFADRRHRAEASLHAKGHGGDWPDWFHQLGDQIPYVVDYQVIDITDDADLFDVYAQCREQWSRANR